MGRNRRSEFFLAFVMAVLSPVLGAEPMLSTSQMNELVRRAQCEISCTKEFATRTNRTLNSGEVVAHFSLSSNEYQQCELGCRNPFSKQGRFTEAFQQGLRFYWEHEISPENNSSAKLTNVTLKCMTLPESHSTNDQSPPLLSGLLIVKYEQPFAEPVRFLFEVRYRAFAPKIGAYEEQLLRFGMTDSRAIWIPKSLVPTVQYRFVVTAVDVGGRVGAPVVSQWIEVPALSFQLQPPVNLSISEQFVADGRLSARVGWSYHDRSFAPRSCFYQVAWANEYQPPHSVDFALDESDGYVLPNLQFDQNYTVSLKSISTIERKVERLESDPVGTLLIAKSCRQLIGPNPFICGLGKVVDFRLAEIDEESGTALVSWTPADNVKVIAGYLLYYRSLPVPGQKSCPLVLEEHEIHLNATASSASLQLNLTSDGCEYVAQIVSFDGNDNASPPAQLTFLYPKRIAQINFSNVIIIFVAVLLTTMAVVALFFSFWLCRQWLSAKCDRWQAIVDKWNMHLLASKTNSSLEPNPLYRLAFSSSVGMRDSVILQGEVELEESRRLRGGSSESLTVTVVSDSSPHTSSTLTSSTLTSSTLTSSTLTSSTLTAGTSSLSSSPTTIYSPDTDCMCFTAAAVPERNRIGYGKFGDVFLLHCTALQCNVALKSFSQ
uniref:Fibronectin type-III domain-containing protein n=1 Tax=Plectus sambesii TaxID=2011161 RepID=A0A914XR58_9BILA